jgi:hypothetical protein
MKRNEIKDLIRQAAMKEMPEVLDRIHLENIEIPKSKAAAFRRAIHFSLAKVLRFAMFFLVLGFTSIFVYDYLTQTPEPQVMALSTEAEVYGFQMVSAASFLGTVTPLSLPITPLSTDPENDDSIIGTKIGDLTIYINIMETLIGDKGALSYTVAESDLPEFAFLLTYDAADLLGNPIKYKIYYNEVPDQTDATKTIIDGIMIKSGIEYQLAGTITDADGTVKTSFKAMLDADNYVLVEDRTTEEGQRYHYTVVENGELANETEIRLVLEENKISAVIDYVDANTEIEYKISKVTNEDDSETIKVKYTCKNNDQADDDENGDIDVGVEYDQASSTYQYRYQVQSNHGNQHESHQYSGNRSDKVDEDDDETPDGEDGGEHNGQGTGNEPGQKNAQTSISVDLLQL